MIGSTEYTGARLAALVAAGEKVRDLSIRLRLPYAAVSHQLAAHVAEQIRPGQRRRRTAEPLFPIGPLTPRSTCPHRGPLPANGIFVCMVCHCGADHLPPETRQHRRKRLYGSSGRSRRRGWAGYHFRDRIEQRDELLQPTQ
jgi:hypothetical protein